jgi:hypothetical protein
MVTRTMTVRFFAPRRMPPPGFRIFTRPYKGGQVPATRIENQYRSTILNIPPAHSGARSRKARAGSGFSMRYRISSDLRAPVDFTPASCLVRGGGMPMTEYHAPLNRRDVHFPGNHSSVRARYERNKGSVNSPHAPRFPHHPAARALWARRTIPPRTVPHSANRKGDDSLFTDGRPGFFSEKNWFFTKRIAAGHQGTAGEPFSLGFGLVRQPRSGLLQRMASLRVGPTNCRGLGGRRRSARGALLDPDRRPSTGRCPATAAVRGGSHVPQPTLKERRTTGRG